jgi:hypothetical protein
MLATRAGCKTDIASLYTMLTHLKTYSAISNGSDSTTWLRHVAGISAVASMYDSDSLVSPLSRYLLQQVGSAQVSSLVTWMKDQVIDRLYESSSVRFTIGSHASRIECLHHTSDARLNWVSFLIWLPEYPHFCRRSILHRITLTTRFLKV